MAAMMEQLRCELGCDGLPGSFLAPTVLWRGLFPTGQFVPRGLVYLCSFLLGLAVLCMSTY